MESSDLGKLPSISEHSIIAVLKKRLMSQKIYTWAGTNLIAVNPFEDVGAFGDSELDALIEELDGRNRPLPAHVHSVAQTAYHGLLSGADQAVIVSGESGAGKTFTAHRLLHYLVRLEERRGAGRAGRAVQHRLNVSSPLLEAFGNARTTNNANSSRFCKLLRLTYGGGRLRGGAVHTCLFEKTRVTRQAPDERSFHVFYQLVAGLPAASLRQLGLERRAARYELAGDASAGDGAQFAVTEAALAELGVSAERRAAVFAVLAALLHLRRLAVTPDGEAFRAERDAALLAAARLLGLCPDRLAAELSEQRLAAGRGSLLRRPCASREEVLARRDCLCRQLYDGLFRWLVEWINAQIAPDAAAPRALSLLDISGFESLENNSLEQLCINYANERLQQYFLSSFLRRLEAAFLSEGLLDARLEYVDNSPLLAALAGPAPSVFGAVEEASGLRLAVTAAQLSDAARRAACAAPGAAGSGTFTVRHFCGPISYEAGRMVEKNRDRVDGSVAALLAGSAEPLVRESAALAAAAAAVPAAAARRRHTVLARLQRAVAELLARLDGADVQYVRCVRPNGCGAPRLVVEAYMGRQLRAAGVLATARLSAAGFPFRLTPEEFADRFAALLPTAARTADPPGRQAVIQTVERWLRGDSEVRVGTGHVFLTRSAWYRLGGVAELVRRRAAARVQRAWRTHRRQRAACTLQRCVRAWLVRRRLEEYLRRQRSARLLQRSVRAWLDRRKLEEYLRRQRAARLLQRRLRTWLERRRLERHIRRQRAARALQRCVRAWLEKRKLERHIRQQRAARCIQRRVRAWLGRRRRAAAALLPRQSRPARLLPDSQPCRDSDGDSGLGSSRGSPLGSARAAGPLFVRRGIASRRRVVDAPLRFHTRRTCLALSHVPPGYLVPQGLLDLL